MLRSRWLLVLLAGLGIALAATLAEVGLGAYTDQETVADDTFSSVDCIPNNNTGLLNPSAQAADTGGDGDGFEVNPTNAFADGGTDPNYYAQSVDGEDDRHRYYDYGFSIDSSCIIAGIEVRLDWWLSTTLDDNSMDVELSWDAGTSWTAAKTDSVESSSEHTTTLGGSSDTWGHAWTVAELSNANFRIRLTSNCSDTIFFTCALRDFFLDWVPVNVYYGPAGAPTNTPTNTPTITPTSCTSGDTGYLDASAEAADTGGDGDGYEGDPDQAFANGNGNAESSGIGDRHRYYNYGVSIPGGCSVTGFTVRLDWWLDSTSGTNSMDIELSWDGGSSWTAAKNDSEEHSSEQSNAHYDASHVLGGSTDTWGRSWTTVETSNANFRVRLTMNSTSGSQDFKLDWVPLKVYYGSVSPTNTPTSTPTPTNTPTPVPSVSQANAWTTGLTHSAGSGSNRLLIFVVGYEDSSNGAVSSVSYGGQSLTPIVGNVAGTSIFARVELWYLNEAGIGAASGNSFSVTWGGSAPTDQMFAAVTYKDVNQSTPISSSSSSSTDSSTPNPLTTDVTVTNGSMAVAAAIAGNDGSYVWNNSWSEGTDQTSGTTTTMSSADHPATAGGTDTASATHSGPNRQVIVAAVLAPN